MRYTLSWCLFGFAGSGDHSAISPCSEQCSNIADGLEKNILNASATTAYDYCDGFSSMVDVNSCADCYARIYTQFYLSNCKSSCFLLEIRTDMTNVYQLLISSIQPVNIRFYPRYRSLSNHPKFSPPNPLPTTPRCIQIMEIQPPVFPVKRNLQLALLFRSFFSVSSLYSLCSGISVSTDA